MFGTLILENLEMESTFVIGRLEPIVIGSIVCEGRFFLGGAVDGGGAKLPTGGILLAPPAMGAPGCCCALLSGRNCLKSSNKSGAPSKSLVTWE